MAEKTGSLKTIAFVSGNMSAHVIGVYTGIENKITKTGSKSYELVHYNTHYDEDRVKDQLDRIALGKKADCVILLSVWPDEESMKLFKKSRIPVIVIEKKVEGAHSILVDNQAGAYMAADHLAKKGRKKIALIIGESTVLKNGDVSTAVPAERQRGYVEALNDNGLEFDRCLVYVVSHAIRDDGYQVFDKMRASNNMPDAVFCAAGDIVAAGFVEAAMKHDVVVPQDISIIGFDDVFEMHMGGIPLTTIRQPLIKIGGEAFDLAVGALSGEIKELKTVIFKPELIIRNSD